MTIKDIEARSGMSRANIRYYESLGLLAPSRKENGYRDYFQSDLDALFKIKLLRSLEVSLEDIASLSRGEAELGEVISRQLEILEAKEQELLQAKELCRLIKKDAVDYRQLDANHYLQQMPLRPSAISAAGSSDKLPRADRPVRRFFARSLDMFIYSALFYSLLLLCGLNIARFSQAVQILIDIFVLFVMLLVEPLLLHKWGSTPGKWLMGLYVRCYDGTKPDYLEGIARTWNVIRYGYGFFIPIYNIVRLCKSLGPCEDGEDLPWEDDAMVLMRDDKAWRWLYLVAGYAVCIALIVLSAVIAITPANRGELTVAEFVENYNEAWAYNYDDSYILTESGEFEQKPQIGNSVVIDIGGFGYPSFDFHEEDGILTGFTISKEVSDPDIWPRSCSAHISTAAQAFIYSTTGNVLSKDLDPLIDWLNDKPFKGFSLSIRGYRLVAKYEYSGYHSSGSTGFLLPNDESKEQHFSFTFSLTPED